MGQVGLFSIFKPVNELLRRAVEYDGRPRGGKRAMSRRAFAASMIHSLFRMEGYPAYYTHGGLYWDDFFPACGTQENFG
jgi:hypothetical protein